MSAQAILQAKRTRDPEATRERILMHAFEEIYAKGYAGASLDQILSESGVTKGALYHHFASKADLAVAIIDEIIRPVLLHQWVEPVLGQDDPVTALIETAKQNFAGHDEDFVVNGCPLNNLTQELANTDELFRTHLVATFNAWTEGFAKAFAHGQRMGTVREELDPDAIGAFVVSGIEGLASTLKTTRDPKVALSAAGVFLAFLETLRTAAPSPAA